MTKRIFWLLGLLVAVSIVLAACTGTQPATPAPEQPTATEEKAAETAPTEEAAAPTAAPAATEEAAAQAPAAEGCTDAIGCVEIAAGDPIHIAWIQTVSGATAPLGTDEVRGVEMAIDDKGVEVLGHPVELTGEDSLCSAEGGQTAGTKIAADPTVVGVIGTTCSSEARAAMPLLADAGMVMISASNTNPDLTDPNHPDHHPGYFRTAHNDLFQGRVAAEYAYNELGVKKVATIHDGSPYAESLQRVFAEVFTGLGGTVTSQEAVNVGDTDMKGVLTKIGADKPELIYLPIFEPEGDFIAAQKCDVQDLADTYLMGADGLLSDTMPEASGECANGMFLSGPYVHGQAYDDFVAKYTEKYGEAPISGYHAHAYDATNILIAAIEKVAVRNDDGSLSIGRQALRDAMYGTRDFKGLTGNLGCNENGDCATGEALAIFELTEAEIVDGKWPPQAIWTPGQAAPAAEAPAAGQTIPAGSFTCEDAIGCVDIAPGDPIHVAWIQTVSGATAPLGSDEVRGVEIAVDDKGGELLGHPIELTGEDSLCSAEGGQAAGTKIAADPTVVGIVGTSCSSEARAAMPLISEAGMVMISGSNTNPDLTNPDHPDHYPGYLRTAHNDLFQGRVAAEFTFNELGIKTAATIHDGSPYAESLQQVFADVFRELGGTITSQEAVNVGDTDMKGVLTKIGADKPGLIYFPIFEPESGFITSQKCDVPDLADTIMMSADGSLSDTFPEASGECAINMYLSGPFVQGQAYDDFVAKYREKYGEAPISGFHAHAYDGANMIFAAIEKVAVMEDDGTLHIGRQALRDAMYATKNFEGLTGNLSCDENGDCATGEAIAIFQLTEAEVLDGAWPPKPFWQPGGGATPAEAPAEPQAMSVDIEPIRIALILPSTISDYAWSQSMYDSLKQIQEAAGGEDVVEIAYTENMFNVTDAAAAIRDYADNGYNLIIAHGAQYGTSLFEIAPDFPNTSFAWGTTTNTGADQGITNVFAYEPRGDEGGYVSGVLAAKLTQAKVIGLVGPVDAGDAKLHVDGFLAGVKDTDPNTKVNVSFTGSFGDTALAAEAANVQVNARADVLTGSSQQVVGAIGVAKEKNIPWIGIQADQSPIAPGVVVATALYDWRNLLLEMIKSHQAGELGGKVLQLTFKNGGIRMIYSDTLPEEAVAAAQAAEAGLVDGSIKIVAEPR
jgi:branched-chain amino acid transport system substrate-binding protein